MAEPTVTLFGPLDAVVGPYIEYVLLVLAVSVLLTRKMAFDAQKRQAEEGDADALSRHPLHVFTLWGLVLASFYYLTLHHHAGVVMTSMVLFAFLTDFFEFEARKVEVREGRDIERPKAAILGFAVVLLYAAYQTLFFIVEPLWNAVV